MHGRTRSRCSRRDGRSSCADRHEGEGLSHAEVGSSTIIDACTLVGERKTIPRGVLALGNPAKVLRELSEAEQERIVTSAEGYWERAREHSKVTKEA